MAGNDWKWLKMAGNDWRLLEITYLNFAGTAQCRGKRASPAPPPAPPPDVENIFLKLGVLAELSHELGLLGACPVQWHRQEEQGGEEEVCHM